MSEIGERRLLSQSGCGQLDWSDPAAGNMPAVGLEIARSCNLVTHLDCTWRVQDSQGSDCYLCPGDGRAGALRSGAVTTGGGGDGVASAGTGVVGMTRVPILEGRSKTTGGAVTTGGGSDGVASTGTGVVGMIRVPILGGRNETAGAAAFSIEGDFTLSA